MIQAKCIRTCTYKGRLWRPGMIYVGAELPPQHFVEIDQDEPEEPVKDVKPKRQRRTQKAQEAKEEPCVATPHNKK